MSLSCTTSLKCVYIMERTRTCHYVIGFPRECAAAGVQTPECKPEAPMSGDFFLSNYEPREKLSRFFTIFLCHGGNFQYCTFRKDAALQRPGSSIPLCRTAVQHPNPSASVPMHSLTSLPAMSQAAMTSALPVF